ncbi:MAG: tetratricopeptide repeat protein, partial [Anaerolineae bacterium]|nr:tetratricopeptide repeat protein [Anaerolineae bacterium]
LYLVRRIAEKPILLLLSSRSGDPQGGLAELLAGLDREQIAQEIKLDPLTHADVAELLKSIFNQPHNLSAEFVEAIYTLTEGNPFFAEEICTSLIARGDIYYVDSQWRRKPLPQIDIPDSVQRLVQQRLDRISPPAKQLIDLAAVSGRSFDFAVLQALTGHSDSELLVLIKELMAAQLVVEESADQFSFRHALTREALYTRLLARERQTLHGQVAQAIEQIHASAPEVHLEALAYHFFEAALWAKALEYAQRAGKKAQALYAPHAAVEQFTRALTAANRLSPSPPSGALYRLRGQAFDTLGDFDHAKADYEAALQAAQAAKDEQTAWQALLDLGLLWASRDYERTGDYCRQALELARVMEDPAAIGHSLNRLGNWLMNSGRSFEALDYHREALGLFEALDDRAGIAGTLDLLAMTSNQSGDVEGAVTYWQQAIPILRDLNDRQTLASSLANVVMYTLNLQQAHEAVELARDIGWRSGEAYALGTLSQTLFALGRYGEALTIRTKSLEIAQAIEHPQWMASSHIFLGQQYFELLALAKAQEHLEQGLALAQQIGSTFFVWLGSGGLASVYILQGQLEAAESLLAELPQEWIPTIFWVRLAQVELALARQDANRMLQLLDVPLTMLPASEKAIGVVSFAHGPALILQGQALKLQGRFDEAEEVLHRARNLYTRHGIAQSLWKIHLALGKLYLAAVRPEQAEESFTAAQVQVDALAATLTDEDLRENFRRRAKAMIPPAQSLTPRQAAKEEFGGLTRRERQVAAVVAQGLSNQEIADELVVSVKTIEAHVTRILSKLGFSSRAQIAAWAVDKGLASAPQDLDSLSMDS